MCLAKNQGRAAALPCPTRSFAPVSIPRHLTAIIVNVHGDTKEIDDKGLFDA
jgi:hypothetical protein